MASVFLTVISFFVGNGYLWPIWGVLGWGLVVAFHGIGVNMMLSDSCLLVADEYNRLKCYAIITAKMRGGILSEESN